MRRGYPDTGANPFTLGVASGDPTLDGVVLWTRLAPSPLNGGKLGIGEDVDLTIEMSTDASFSSITRPYMQWQRRGMPTPHA